MMVITEMVQTKNKDQTMIPIQTILIEVIKRRMIIMIMILKVIIMMITERDQMINIPIIQKMIILIKKIKIVIKKRVKE